VAAHVRDVAERSDTDSDRLAGLMLRWAWPDGHSDRFDVVAAEWLGRWSPVMIRRVPAACSCLDGHCPACN
jgi:hypothetical protein